MIQSLNTARLSALVIAFMSLLGTLDNAAIAAQPGFGMNHLSAKIDAPNPLVPGKITILGLILDIDEDWRTYWPGINDTGYGVSIDFTPIEGLTFHDPVFPTPKRYIAAGNILDHTYEGEIVILVPVSVDSSFSSDEEVTLHVEIDYLICKEVCIPESVSASTKIQINPDSSSEAQLSVYESAYRDRPIYVGINKPIVNDPVTGETYIPYTSWNNDEVTLKIDGATHYKFFPGADCSPPLNLIAQGESKNDSITIAFDRQYEDDPSAAARLSGRLSVKFQSGWRDFDIDFKQPLKQETTP